MQGLIADCIRQPQHVISDAHVIVCWLAPCFHLRVQHCLRNFTL